MADDLYGDLDTSTQALAKTEVLQQKQRMEKQNDELKAQLAVLQRENRTLGERNKTLETNISTLFVTAQHELKRKDAEIARLREALAKHEQSDRRPTPRDYTPRRGSSHGSSSRQPERSSTQH